MAGSPQSEDASKTENSIPVGVKQQEILDFIAHNADSDVKSIANAVNLRPSHTRDYLKQLIDQNLIICHGDYRNKTYSIKND